MQTEAYPVTTKKAGRLGFGAWPLGHTAPDHAFGRSGTTHGKARREKPVSSLNDTLDPHHMTDMAMRFIGAFDEVTT